MGVQLAGRNEWALCTPSREGIDALRRIHRGEPRRSRWRRLLDRLREALA